MTVTAPKENAGEVDKAYVYIMDYLRDTHGVQKHPLGLVAKLNPGIRDERNAAFKEALRQLFELDAWEGF